MGMSWGNSVNSFRRTAENTSKDMEKDIQKVVDQTGTEAKRNAQSRTPVLTGKLKAGWKGTKKGKGGKRRVEIVNSVPYAVYVENGTSKAPPRNMLKTAMLIAQQRLQRRLDALKRKTANNFNRGA